MRDLRAMQQIELLLGQMNAVREHGAIAEQTVAVVDIRVFGLREELVHPLHFAS